MDRLNQQEPHERRPSLTSEPETPAASSDVHSSQPFPPLQHPSPASSRNTKKLVIDSAIARPITSQLIKRKPPERRKTAHVTGKNREFSKLTPFAYDRGVFAVHKNRA